MLVTLVISQISALILKKELKFLLCSLAMYNMTTKLPSPCLESLSSIFVEENAEKMYIKSLFVCDAYINDVGIQGHFSKTYLTRIKFTPDNNK